MEFKNFVVYDTNGKIVYEATNFHATINYIKFKHKRNPNARFYIYKKVGEPTTTK